MAGAFKVKHPYHDPGLSKAQAASLERAVKRVMAMTEEDVLALVPTQTAIMFCGCPNCDGGAQECGQFAWTIDKPHQITCRYCGHVFPSDKYPMDKSETVKNPLGQKVTVRYHLDPQGADYYFEGVIWRSQKHWLIGQACALARAYHVTRKPQYARRAALILDRFAQVYPGLCVVKQWPFRRRRYTSRTKPPFPSAGGKWGRWMPAEIPTSLPLAYDLIHDSPELDKLSKELGADVRKRIENDFFRATIAYTLTFKGHMGNMAPFYVTGMIRIGRAIGEPAYVHWAARWVRQILETRFFYDGMWCEAPSYHYQTVGGIRRVLDALKGYSDPPGYKGKEDGLRLENLDLEKSLPFLARALGAPATIAYPDGRVCPVHDTWANSKYGRRPRKKTVCRICPGYGHAVLGAGTGDQQTQAHLHFSGGYGHTHLDSLNLALFAFGREMLADVGYTHTSLRWWSICTTGHNLVAIDRTQQWGSNSDGDLLMYVPNLPGLSVVEASGKRAYGSVKAETYRRLVMLVSIDEARPYVVDVFHVKGGATHDWLLHGSANHGQAAACSLDVKPRDGTLLEKGEKWVKPVGESSRFNPYGVMRNVRAGATDGPWHATFSYTDEPALGSRVHMLGAPGTEVFLCETPSVRRAGRDERHVYDHYMPQLIVRRRGTKPLETVFVAVHEPFRGKPHILSVEQIDTAVQGGNAIGLRVRLKGRTDTVLVTLGGAKGTLAVGKDGVSLAGRVGLVSEADGRVAAAYLVGGQRLTKGKLQLALERGDHEGEIEAATREADGAASDAFVVSGKLPGGAALRGSWMIVTHGSGHTHGYGIARVEERDGKTWVHLLADHGLRIDGKTTQECYFPRRTIKGKNRYRIHATAMLAPPASPVQGAF